MRNIFSQHYIYNGQDYNQQGIIIATGNKLFHQSICSQLKEIIDEFDLLK